MSDSNDWRSAADGFEFLGDELVHQGFVWHLATSRFASPDGTEFTRDIVRSPGAVAVLPLMDTADGPAVVLVSQYRPPYERALLEIPAGMRDVDGEPPSATAQRELVEEAGLKAGELIRVTEVVPSPAMTDATCIVYLATGCTAVEVDRQGPEEQHMVLVEMMLDDAIALIDNGTIEDAKTTIALLMARRFVDGDLKLTE